MHAAAGRLRPDLAVARIAARQRGLVTRAQLQAAGLSRSAIGHRIAAGRLHRIHRGVYLVGHPAPPPLAPELAAVLASGPAAVLSHRSAAALWGLMAPPEEGVEITVPGGDPGRRPGLLIHTTRRLEPRDVTRRHGIPVTAVGRTLLDLASIAGTRELERAVHEAETRRLIRRRALLAFLDRTAGRAGAPALRALLRSEQGPALTRSEAEERMLALVRTARLPPPEVNVRIGAKEVDLLWRRERLVVEIDGYAYHSSRAAFERDRRRDGELQAEGFRVMRVTWRQLTDEREALVARLAQSLGALERSTA